MKGSDFFTERAQNYVLLANDHRNFRNWKTNSGKIRKLKIRFLNLFLRMHFDLCYFMFT